MRKRPSLLWLPVTVLTVADLWSFLNQNIVWSM